LTHINWAPMISLIGGFPLGAEKAFGIPPVANYTYEGFAKNDSHYNHYMTEVRKLNMPYVNVDEYSGNQKLDVVVGTPPCAALSQLNTGLTEAAKGAKCEKNEWMYRVFEDSIDKFNSRVVVVENAPALFTNKGKDVADRLFEISQDRGYSLTLYKTSTMYHGIPQNRQRTFAIAWDSKYAPIMGWYKRDRKSFTDYVTEIQDGDLQQDIVINHKIYNEPYFSYIRAMTNRDPRELMLESKINTAFQYVHRKFGLENALKWFEDTNNEDGVKYCSHAIKKHSIGKGIWDGSTHVFGDVMNAVIGRNMNDTIHPHFDRSLTVREALHMMGFPKDFELLGGKPRINEIAQNVPTCTARDICIEIKKYLSGDLKKSASTYVKQDNTKERIEYVNKESHSVEHFFA